MGRLRNRGNGKGKSRNGRAGPIVTAISGACLVAGAAGCGDIKELIGYGKGSSKPATMAAKKKPTVVQGECVVEMNSAQVEEALDSLKEKCSGPQSEVMPEKSTFQSKNKQVGMFVRRDKAGAVIAYGKIQPDGNMKFSVAATHSYGSTFKILDPQLILGRKNNDKTRDDNGDIVGVICSAKDQPKKEGELRIVKSTWGKLKCTIAGKLAEARHARQKKELEKKITTIKWELKSTNDPERMAKLAKDLAQASEELKKLTPQKSVDAKLAEAQRVVEALAKAQEVTPKAKPAPKAPKPKARRKVKLRLEKVEGMFPGLVRSVGIAIGGVVAGKLEVKSVKVVVLVSGGKVSATVSGKGCGIGCTSMISTDIGKLKTKAYGVDYTFTLNMKRPE